ncbi:hypothetical protein GVAV_000476 [Gurleya vavrai]
MNFFFFILTGICRPIPQKLDCFIIFSNLYDNLTEFKHHRNVRKIEYESIFVRSHGVFFDIMLSSTLPEMTIKIHIKSNGFVRDGTIKVGDYNSSFETTDYFIDRPLIAGVSKIKNCFAISNEECVQKIISLYLESKNLAQSYINYNSRIFIQ